MSKNKGLLTGFGMLAIVVSLAVLVLIVVVLVLISGRTPKELLTSKEQDVVESVDGISDSDETSVLEKELNSTTLEEVDRELENVGTDLDSIR